ncbi:hypothetical protein JY443_12975, partial [Stenotrophomonas maltophilia]|nr:hypothetical protein [Stenotrophomonas maltophilia]
CQPSAGSALQSAGNVPVEGSGSAGRWPAVSTQVDTYQQHSPQRIGWKALLLFKGARRRRGDKVECAGSSAYAPSA